MVCRMQNLKGICYFMQKFMYNLNNYNHKNEIIKFCVFMPWWQNKLYSDESKSSSFIRKRRFETGGV